MSGSDDKDDMSRHHQHHRRSNIPQEVKYPPNKKPLVLKSTVVVRTTDHATRLESVVREGEATPDTLATRMNTLSTSTYTCPSSPQSSSHQPVVETFYEPLKIGLDSGDDSSVTSDVDDDYDYDDCDSDYFFGFTTTANTTANAAANAASEDVEHDLHTSPTINNQGTVTATTATKTFELFHKQPHKTNENKCTNHYVLNDASTSSSTSSSSSPVPIHEEIQGKFNTSFNSCLLA